MVKKQVKEVYCDAHDLLRIIGANEEMKCPYCGQKMRRLGEPFEAEVS